MNVLLLRLWIQATADRKRFGLFGVLLAVGMLLWARIIVISNPPRTAVAVPGGNTAVAPTPLFAQQAGDLLAVEWRIRGRAV